MSSFAAFSVREKLPDTKDVVLSATVENRECFTNFKGLATRLKFILRVLAIEIQNCEIEISGLEIHIFDNNTM